MLAVAVAMLLGTAPGIAQPQPPAFILMYHHVSDTVQPGPYARALTVTPREFGQQLAWLRKHGCAAVTVTTLYADVTLRSQRGCEVAVTLDDGYDDSATHALPLLQEAGDAATFYVTTGFLNAQGHLSGRQVRTLAQAGMEIGAHTIDHLDLTTLSGAEVEHQVAASASKLQELSGAPVRTFAYPSGQTNARIQDVVKAAGLQTATTTIPGMMRADAAFANPYALPRFRIEHNTGMGVLSSIVATDAPAPLRSAAEVRSIARKRVEGNDLAVAERIGAAILDASYPEPLLKVRALRVSSGTFIGIVLSGKAHREITRGDVTADAAGMILRGFAASPSVVEVDIWAVEPLAVVPRTVSGDLAEPTTRTVFSAAVTRAQAQAARTREQFLGITYFEPSWLKNAPTR